MYVAAKRLWFVVRICFYSYSIHSLEDSVPRIVRWSKRVARRCFVGCWKQIKENFRSGITLLGQMLLHSHMLGQMKEVVHNKSKKTLDSDSDSLFSTRYLCTEKYKLGQMKKGCWEQIKENFRSGCTLLHQVPLTRRV